MSDHGSRLEVGKETGELRGGTPQTRPAYGDERCVRGRAYWVLWSVETGRWAPERYHCWAEAEAARNGRTDQLPCLQYAWADDEE